MATATSERKVLTLKVLANRVMDLIGEGRMDNYLEAIMAECNARRRVVHEQLARKNARELSKLGTRVRFADTTKPRYLAGLAGEIVSRPIGFRNRAKPMLYVKLDDPGLARKYGEIVGAPPTILEKE